MMRNIKLTKILNSDYNLKTEKLMRESITCISGLTGQRARVPPEPIPNSEVKPRSVLCCSVVFGHVNQRKLATPLKNYF